jgi:hypothetical protein
MSAIQWSTAPLPIHTTLPLQPPSAAVAEELVAAMPSTFAYQSTMTSRFAVFSAK